MHRPGTFVFALVKPFVLKFEQSLSLEPEGFERLISKRSCKSIGQFSGKSDVREVAEVDTG